MRRYSRPRAAARTLLLLLMAALLVPAAAPAKKKKKNKKPGKNEAVVIGTVLNQEKEPIAGARVTVTAEAVPEFQAEATSDDDGEFTVRIEDPVGEYAFHLEAEGYTPFDGEAPLTAGEQAVLGFELLDAATGRRQEAIKAFNAGVESFNQNRFDDAEAEFLAATELDPGMVEPYQGLAEIYYREKSWDEAAAAIEKFLAAHPDNTSGLTLAYSIYREKGDAERTSELVDALGKTDKAKPLARQIYNEGVALAQRGDNASAVERFRRAASLDPELSQAYSSEATILYNMERYDEVEAALEKLFALDPENKQGRRVRYLLYDARNDEAKAAEALEAYLEADPDGAVDVMYQRADMDFRGGNTAKAIAALEKILEHKPDMPRAHYTLGLCYTSSDKAKAKEHLERFLELAPDDPEAPSAKEILSYM